MASNAVNNIALDGSSGRIRWHLSIFPLTKLSGGGEKKKIEKVNFIGEQYATAVTPGVIEIEDLEAELTTVVWKEMLAAFPDQFGEIEFPITFNERHVTLATGYTICFDRCSIIGTKQEIEASEKARKVTLTLRCMLVHHKGADGTKKTMGRRPGVSLLSSPAAQQLGF